MSRIFEALRKSQQTVEEPFVSRRPQPEPVEEIRGLHSVATERMHLRYDSHVIVHKDPGSVGADRFRLLAARLRQRLGEKKTLLVTSALPEDGKSTTSLNLATVLADQGKRSVMLMEADLYRPGLTSQLGLRSWQGLAECLQGECEPLAALRRIEPLGWYLMPAGRPVQNPTTLVHSERLAALVKGLAPRFDWILMDSPPANPVADILALKAKADGCVLVVRAGRTPREAVEETLQQLGREHVVGIVLNAVGNLDKRYSKYYGKYYGHQGRNGSGPSKRPVE